MEYQLITIMPTTKTHHKSSPPRGQRGLSLVELMISLTIGLILLLGITTLIVQQSSSRDELEKSSRQIENGRYAVQLLHDDLEHAGFYGNYFNLPAPPAAMPDPCITTPLTGSGSLDEAMSLPIQGYDVLPSATTTSPITCLDSRNYKQGTDILVIRRADSNPVSVAAATGTGGQVYLQSTPASHLLGTGSNTAAFTLTYNTSTNTSVAELRRYLVHIYYISPCSVPAGGGTTCTCTQSAGSCIGADDNGSPIPTLKMLELSASGATTSFKAVPLVEGIENMQFDYGIDADSDGYPDNNYTTVPASTTDWSNVMAIRLNLLARNTECTTGYTDSKTYALGQAGNVSAPAATCTNGGFKRHAFSALVRAVNISGRRAQQ